MELTRRKGSVVYDENTDTLDFEGHKFTGFGVIFIRGEYEDNRSEIYNSNWLFIYW